MSSVGVLLGIVLESGGLLSFLYDLLIDFIGSFQEEVSQVVNWVVGDVLAKVDQALGQVGNHVVHQVLPDGLGSLVEEVPLLLPQLLQLYLVLRLLGSPDFFLSNLLPPLFLLLSPSDGGCPLLLNNQLRELVHLLIRLSVMVCPLSHPALLNDALMSPQDLSKASQPSLLLLELSCLLLEVEEELLVLRRDHVDAARLALLLDDLSHLLHLLLDRLHGVNDEHILVPDGLVEEVLESLAAVLHIPGSVLLQPSLNVGLSEVGAVLLLCRQLLHSLDERGVISLQGYRILGNDLIIKL
eukprot:CAMPEP_0168616990 /NCGR_PEP_ID=MMETSP0449_2-20121227/5312_1 /TAXON_ID=1082188 /ORGANISM="Strombidium rassoulzadegani, Strain ras09" /LENGTH=297 /DNA_ID=CAMNT_0008657793 /DNA_START=29 /DNA_END=918 /DNA_ORIENTATION=+